MQQAFRCNDIQSLQKTINLNLLNFNLEDHKSKKHFLYLETLIFCIAIQG